MVAPDATLVREKLGQTPAILEEHGVDLWLTLVRETLLTRDPCLDLVAGTYCAWQSAFLLSRSGERVAIVGRFDAPSVEALGAYPEVIAYDESIRPALRSTVERLDPRSIALNYSPSDPAADGLTHGLWLMLCEALEGTRYADRLVSSAPIVNALRGRKSPSEIERIREAVRTTEEIFAVVDDALGPAMKETEIAELMHAEVARRGLGYAWEAAHCPAVNAGPEKEVGHSAPGALETRRGELLHCDFGVEQDGYCSDLQRVWYLLAEGESEPPDDVAAAWRALWAAVGAGAGAHEPRLRRIPGAHVRARSPAGPVGTRRRHAPQPALGSLRRRPARHGRGRQRVHAGVRHRSPRSRLHRARGGRARHLRRHRVAEHAAARPLARDVERAVSPSGGTA
jgi:Xaa-Pro aminopeptidase